MVRVDRADGGRRHRRRFVGVRNGLTLVQRPGAPYGQHGDGRRRYLQRVQQHHPPPHRGQPRDGEADRGRLGVLVVVSYQRGVVVVVVVVVLVVLCVLF